MEAGVPGKQTDTEQIMKTEALVSILGRVMDDLLASTRASRVTLRVDVAEHGFQVNLPAAEALSAGAKSLKAEGSLDQRAAETVKWLEREHRLLVQNDVYTDGPSPPQALIDIYGTRAQMLGPLFVEGQLGGWISVHQNGSARNWSDEDTAALTQAVNEVHLTLYGGR